jgi:LAO/AO transport system kinase
VILLETVGVGQDEVEIVGTADVSIVVLVPGLGDEVQALKAGIMEIADIFVVNKADREGAERVVSEIESMLSLATSHGPSPVIVRTVASEDRGIPDVLLAIGDFRRQAESSGLLARRRRAHLRQQFEDALRERLTEHVLVHVLGRDEVERTVDALAAGSLDPLNAAHAVLHRMGMA